MTRSKEIWRKAIVLAIAGGLAFWIANFAISRTPIAAAHRTVEEGYKKGNVWLSRSRSVRCPIRLEKGNQVTLLY